MVTYSLDQLDRLSNEKWYTVSGTVPEVTVTTTTQGATGVNEVQQIDVAQLSSGSPGTFRLAFNGQTTRAIAWNANAATVKSALEELSAVGANNVSVAGPTFPTGLRRYVVTFVGVLANSNVPQIHGSSRYNTDPAVAERTLTWTFDNGGRLSQASDPAATYNYTLDNLDRVTVETQNSAGIGLVPTVRMTRGYDLVGNRTSLAAEFQTGAAVTKDFTNSYKFFDEVTSLSLHWHRWLDTNLGKWVSEDPIGFGGGDPNLGRYVGNRVFRYVDPTGLNQDDLTEEEEERIEERMRREREALRQRAP